MASLVVLSALTGNLREMFRQKVRANEVLRYAIRMCQGGCCKCPNNTRFALILRLKDDLEKMGAVWQVRCLNFHLHKFQREFMTTKNVKKGGYNDVPDGSEINSNKTDFEKPDFENLEKLNFEKKDFSKKDFENLEKINFEKKDFSKKVFEKKDFEKKVFEKKDFEKKVFEKGNCGGVSCA